MENQITHVMDTLIEPAHRAHFTYAPGQYVFVHTHAVETAELDALECLIINVDLAPLEIMVHPCNHPEDVRVVRQDQLSAPIYV